MKKANVRAFFKWVNERHNIYLKKESGDPWPWTKDPILKEYKFTNVFRQLDAETKNLCDRLGKRDTEATLFTKIIIFRMFNWSPTYDILEGAGLVDKWSTAMAIKLLHSYANRGHKIFTGAYIITNNGLKESKIHLVCSAIGRILEDKKRLIKRIKDVNTLEYAVKSLSEYPMVGGFIGYELVTDLRHTKILHHARDVMKWANLGPGAKRGVNRIYNDDPTNGGYAKGGKISYQVAMRELLALSPEYTSSYVPALEMRDIEHSLCEFDKYTRVKKGEGRPRSKYKRKI